MLRSSTKVEQPFSDQLAGSHKRQRAGLSLPVGSAHYFRGAGGIRHISTRKSRAPRSMPNSEIHRTHRSCDQKRDSFQTTRDWISPPSNWRQHFRRKRRAPEHQKATAWWLFGCAVLIQLNAEFFTEDGFDAFEIFFHEGEFFLDVCKPLQELVESFGQFIQTLGKAFFRLCQALVDRSQDSDFLCDELLLHPLVLSDKALFNPFVLSGELLIDRLQNNRCLLRQQFLDLRKYGRLLFVRMCGC